MTELTQREFQQARLNMLAMRAWLRRAKEIINSAYACPEWMATFRTERTDETEQLIRDYLSEFGDDEEAG